MSSLELERWNDDIAIMCKCFRSEDDDDNNNRWQMTDVDTIRIKTKQTYDWSARRLSRLQAKFMEENGSIDSIEL